MHSISSIAEAQVHARTALELAEELGEPTLLAHALSHVAFLDSLTGDGVAIDTIERALALNPNPGWTQILGRPDWTHALLLFWDGRLAEARDRFAALHEEALERGDEHSLPFVLFQLARVELLLGDWESARRHAAECGETVAQSGHAGERPYAAAILAVVAAHVGAVDEARAHISVGLEEAERLGVQPAALEMLAARGFLELSVGDAAAGRRDVRRAARAGRGERDARAGAVPVARGRDRGQGAARAARWTCSLDRARPWVQSVAARCDAAWSAFNATDARRATRAANPSSARGRCSCSAPASAATASGGPRATRSARRSRRSRPLGAPLWAEKARAELSRVGGRAPAEGELTPTERRVAELIAAGRTYQEAADALFISPKTVQWNLSKIYRKLGIKSRAELPGRLDVTTNPGDFAGFAPGRPAVASPACIRQ